MSDLRDDWAYDFACDLTIEAILEVFAQAGPWPWQLRDSAWYGDYLNSRPAKGVRVRIHEYPQGGAGGEFTGLRESGFSALLQIDSESRRTKAEIDAAFRGLLDRVGASDLQEIEPYD